MISQRTSSVVVFGLCPFDILVTMANQIDKHEAKSCPQAMETVHFSHDNAHKARLPLFCWIMLHQRNVFRSVIKN